MEVARRLDDVGDSVWIVSFSEDVYIIGICLREKCSISCRKHDLLSLMDYPVEEYFNDDVEEIGADGVSLTGTVLQWKAFMSFSIDV